MIPSTCNNCGVPILVNQKEYNDPFAHICPSCQTSIFAGVLDDEEDDDGGDLQKKFLDALDALDAFHFDEELGAEDFLDEEIVDNEFEYLEPRKCTCGAAKANVPGHATWCDLYE